MTWKEFKEEVERQMEEKDIPLDAEIDWIDVSAGWFQLQKIYVNYTKVEGLAIS
jgi:hypothetical protein